jgi:hypothetical protein
MKEVDPLEEIDVVARFDHSGRISPLKFTWRQVEYPVTSVGRSWQDDAGHHILVMVPGEMLGSPGERVVELVYQPGVGRWWLRQPPRPRVA